MELSALFPMELGGGNVHIYPVLIFWFMGYSAASAGLGSLLDYLTGAFGEDAALYIIFGGAAVAFALLSLTFKLTMGSWAGPSVVREGAEDLTVEEGRINMIFAARIFGALGLLIAFSIYR